MSRKKISRNAPCPCGSGKKYKHCCSSKGFEYVQDENGTVFKSVPMTGEAAQALQDQRQKFIDKHGREPGPDDPVFFDAPPLEHVENEIVQAMKATGLNPELIYAFEKTGLLVTEDNRHLIPEKDLEEWDAAIREYEEKNDPGRPRKPKARGEGPPRYPLATIAYYGPNGTTTTKIAAGIFLHAKAKAIIQRWVGTDVMTSRKVQRELQEFFEQHGVKSVAMSEGNMGCPHEEGEDFPLGEDCPFCPFWKGKQGSNRRD